MQLINIYKAILKAITSRERRSLYALTVLNILISLIDLFSIVFVLIAISYYTAPTSLINSFPFLGAMMPRNHHLLPAFALLLLFVLKHIIGHFIFRKQRYFIMGVATRISGQNLASYLHGRYADYTNKDSATHVRNILHIPTEFAQYVLLNSQLMITELFLVLTSVTLLLLFKTALFLILLLTLAPVLLLLFYLTRKRLTGIKHHLKRITEQSLQYLQEALSGFVESNVYAKNSYFINRHRQGQRQINGYVAQMQLMQDLPPRYFEIFAIFGLVILMLLGSNAGMDGTYVVIINAFMAAAYKIIPGVARIINLNNQLRTYLFTLEEVNGQITPARPLGQSSISPFPAVPLNQIDTVRLRRVSFSYKDIPILARFNADFKNGTLSIVYGQSGKGKSTLFNLLLSLCHPGAGTIFFNETPITDIQTTDLWERISYMKQTPFLLHATLLDNIVLFERNYHAKQLQYALEVSGIAGQFEEGLDKMIMEHGRNISGGQRQRIMLARALYKDFDLLLLDEPFSELDDRAVQQIMLHLRAITRLGKIIILISHNRQLSRHCHQVIDLDCTASFSPQITP